MIFRKTALLTLALTASTASAFVGQSTPAFSHALKSTEAAEAVDSGVDASMAADIRKSVRFKRWSQPL